MVRRQFVNNMERGFGTLFVIIILGGIALALTLWISTSTLWSIRGSIDNRASSQTKALVNACAEIALEAMRENTAYTGSASQRIGSDTCTYSVTSAGGSNRTIMVSGTVGAVTRKLQITTTAFNPITISSWQDVP